MNKIHPSLSLAFLISIASYLTSCTPPAPTAQALAAVPVNIDTVELQKASYFDIYPANVLALNEVEIRSEVSGFITNITFQEGRFVRAGQKLYEIEKSKYAAAYAQAEAALNIAKSDFNKAQKDAERYSRLGEKGMTTKQRVEYVQTDVENAKTQVAAAEAGLQRAATDLRHATITAPFDGTIGISLLKKGGYVTAGQTLLNTVSSDNPVAVDFVISEKEISRFAQLKEKSNPKDSLFTILLPDKTVYPYVGQIEFLDRAVDPRTGTLKIRLRFQNPKQFLKPGMSCNIRVLNKTPQDLPIIPFKAVTEQMGEFYVYVVERDTAFQHKVLVGAPLKDKIIIKEGLNAGQRIVVEGVQKLRNATPVTIGIPAQGGPQGAGAPNAGSPTATPAKK